jgi:hypothetical protein
MSWFQKVLNRFKSCPEEAGDAVLTVLYPLFNSMPSASMMFNGDYEPAAVKGLDDYQKEIFRIRTWARETPMDVCVRKEYHNWLNFYQRRLDEVLEEVRTRSRQKNYEEFKQRELLENLRRQEYLLANPIPVPPRKP